MQKRLALATLALTFLAGCATDTTTAPNLVMTAAKGVSSPNTTVGSSFVVYVEGTTYYAGSGPSRNGQGECRTHADGTTGWYWVPGNTSGGKTGKGGGASTGEQEVGPEHAQCRYVSPTYTVTVSFTDTATYVKATSGNYNLNFNPVCVPSIDGITPPACDYRYVHYQANSNITQGFGVLHGVGVSSLDASTSNWTIDLTQIYSTTNLISDPPRKLLLMAHNSDGTYPDSPAEVSW